MNRPNSLSKGDHIRMYKKKIIIIGVLLIFIFVFSYWFLLGSDKGILVDKPSKNISSEEISLSKDINNFNQAYNDSQKKVTALDEKFYLYNFRTDSLSADTAKYVEFKYVKEVKEKEKEIKIYRYYYGNRTVEIVTDYSTSTLEEFDKIDDIDVIILQIKSKLNILSADGINNITDIECYQNRADIFIYYNDDSVKISIEYLKS